MEKCNLCPRGCLVNRQAGERGYCGMTQDIMIARAALHFWEEPCISGSNGSGAVFFTGCPLRCVFCQNRKIAIGRVGMPVSVHKLVEIFFELKDNGKIVKAEMKNKPITSTVEITNIEISNSEPLPNTYINAKTKIIMPTKK